MKGNLFMCEPKAGRRPRPGRFGFVLIVAAICLFGSGCGSDTGSPPSRSQARTGFSGDEFTAVSAAAHERGATSLVDSFALAQTGLSDPRFTLDTSAAVPVYRINPDFVSGGRTGTAPIGCFSYAAVPLYIAGRSVDTLQVSRSESGEYSATSVASGDEETAMAGKVARGARLLLFQPTHTWFQWDGDGLLALASQTQPGLVGQRLARTDVLDMLHR